MRSVQVRGMWLGFAYEWRVVGDGAGELWRQDQVRFGNQVEKYGHHRKPLKDLAR